MDDDERAVITDAEVAEKIGELTNLVVVLRGKSQNLAKELHKLRGRVSQRWYPLIDGLLAQLKEPLSDK